LPNRILREGILTSPRVAKLAGWADEVFYRRLMSVVDDFGRYYADQGLLRAACYPRQLNKVSDSDIGKWLTACVNAALVRVYPASDGERYLQLLDFRQQARAAKSKFPQPPSECIAGATQEQSGGGANAPVFGDVFGGVDALAPTVLVGLAPDAKPEPYRVPPCPYDAIVEAYARCLPALPQVTVLNDSRKSHVNARWREVCGQEKFTAEQGAEWFGWYFDHASKAPFLVGSGKPNREGRVWRADFDWLLLPTNFAKVVEGRYHGKVAA